MSPLFKLAALLLCAPSLFSVEVEFAPPKDIASGGVSGVSSMDAGDINGDGIGDVVIIEGGKHAGGRQTFAWFEGPANVQGAWKRHNFGNAAPLRSFLGAAKLADMDDDGDLDLIVSSDNHSGSNKKADIFVYVNPGKGHVTGTWSYHTANASVLPVHHFNDMEIADLDDDGKLDIVARSLTPNQIHIFFQNSISDYTHKVIDTNISSSEGLSVGYLDGDRYPDITYTGHWLKSPGNPRTQNYTKLNIDSNYKNVNQNTKEAIGDIDGDGLNDIIISPAEAYRNGGDTYIAWYKNPGNTSSANWQRSNLVNKTNNTHTIKLGDIDNDGDLDVVTGTPWSNAVSQVSVRVYYNTDGKGAFSTAQVVASGKGLYSGVLYDIDGDGDLEIIGQDKYAKKGKPYIYENLLDGAPGSNQKPTAVAEANASGGLAPVNISFNGSASHDSDGNITAYAWDFGDGSTAVGINVAHTYASAGTYTARLTVTDNDGAVDADTLIITVSEPASERDAFSRIEAESFDAKKGIGIYNGGTGKKIGSIENKTHAVYHRVNFGTGANRVHASCSNNNSTNSNIEFRLGAIDGSLLGTMQVPVTGGWNTFIDLSIDIQSVAGTHDLYLVFTGGGGALLDVDYVQFEQGVTPEPNQAPVADLQASANSGQAPTRINFDARASSDSDGSIVSYDWNFGDGNNDNGAQAAHTFSSAGVYTVTLTVTDDDGASDSNSVQITITEPATSERDAFARIEAESFDAKQGLAIYNGGTGKKIGSIEDGTYVVYEAVDFAGGASSFTASCSNRQSSNSNIEIRLGSKTGTLIGSVHISVTGGWNNFVEVQTNVNAVSGVHDVYLVFTGGGGPLLDVDYFQFVAGNPVVGRDAFSRIEAETYDAMKGIGIYDGGTGQKIGSIENGTHAMYKDVNFGDGAATFEARVSCDRRAGSIELRLGSKTGTLVGTCDIPVTGGWENFIDVTCSIDQVSGVHDLYFVFTSDKSRALFDVDYFQFTQSPAALMPAPTAVSINFQPATAETVEGYLIDSGATFANRGNGYSYGWSVLNDESRDRNHVDARSQLEDTFNHFSKNGDKSWSISLPNGAYEVSLVCGDPQATNQVNTLQVGDVLLTDDDGQDHFDSYTVLVEISDGLLRIAPAGNASNAKICYLEIIALASGNG